MGGRNELLNNNKLIRYQAKSQKNSPSMNLAMQIVNKDIKIVNLNDQLFQDCVQDMYFLKVILLVIYGKKQQQIIVIKGVKQDLKDIILFLLYSVVQVTTNKDINKKKLKKIYRSLLNQDNSIHSFKLFQLISVGSGAYLTAKLIPQKFTYPSLFQSRFNDCFKQYLKVLYFLFSGIQVCLAYI
ncbi:unnamed protein product (macronuclear) [Paramecium tetraurelia]|uniref:Transmembrane protein n=1 Tax=Paramecium tetraurelia TaxID=5888 RepID=A0E4S3_PARTE|nr:uncharacterized protein GSPATT00023465001 [Paramecium tetraurelia]CAK90290.1 unnamed protein product [Paramecium tetraurelia]|eukprot:XP_001457687.1 hypothetical protein (macronuclear) [Paramecium tetraurelia strain d4-2]